MSLIKSKLDEVVTDLGIKANSIDLSKIKDYTKPDQVRDEIPTLNKFGYMKQEFENFSRYFLELASVSEKPVLEVGPAYGWLTHKILDADGTIVASDISIEHLEVLVKNAPSDKLENLYIYPGRFPDEIEFPSGSFSSVMMSRIIHFLKGDEVISGLKKVHEWLDEDGILLCTNCSIYHSSVKGDMKDIFEQRIANKEEWAGMTYKDNFDSVHDKYSADFLNCFYKEQLEELIPTCGFKIERIEYFDYPSDPWPDEGKGHIGFIAKKV